MKIIKPTQITDSQFVSCTIPENDYPAWSAATAYTVGQKVIRAATHRIYERLIAGTTAAAPEVDPVNWLDLGATNRWRMFDQKVGTVSSADTSFTVTIRPGVATALALIGLSAGSVTVTMTDPVEGLVFQQTYGTYDPIGIGSWYAWFFDEVRRRDTLVITGLPSYRNAEIEITVADNPGAQVGVGALIVGQRYEFARAVLAGASIGIQDYSRKERDDFGNYYVAERSFARRASWDFIIDNADVDYLQRILSGLRATPAVYLGGGDFDSTVIYGFFKDFDTVIAYPNHSQCTIDLEGLI